jgi:hypothetical protein
VAQRHPGPKVVAAIGQQSQLIELAGAVSGSATRSMRPAVLSTGYPSRAQYSNPPIISFTLYPSRANASAARVDPLQPGPQQ